MVRNTYFDRAPSMALGRACGSVILLLLFAGCSTQSYSQVNDYRQGLNAFKAGDYAAALRAFQRHYREHNASPHLLYNLGVCHYKLDQLPEAREAFLALSEKPEWRPLALLNIAVVAEASGEIAMASDTYREVIALAPKSRPASLAERALVRLTPSAPENQGIKPKPNEGHSAQISIALGHDNNPYSLDRQLSAETGSDLFTDILLTASNSMGGSLVLEGWFFTRHYNDFMNLNFTGAQGKLSQGNTSDYRQALSFTQMMLDGDRYTTDITGHLTFPSAFGQDDLTLNIDAAYVHGGGQYDYLDGIRLRAALSKSWGTETYQAVVGYRLQYDDRADVMDQQTLLIESGQKHLLSTRLLLPLNDRTDLSLFGSYRYTRRKENARSQDYTAVEAQERGIITSITTGVEINYQFQPKCSLSLQALYETADEALDFYRYDRMPLTVTIHYEI